MKKIIKWFIKIIGYSLVLISIAIIFNNNIYIDNNYYGIWSIIASIIIYTLNNTIKPILVTLTIPLTALTLGLFYPFINILILKIVSIILANHFIIKGNIIMIFIIAVTISIMNKIIDKIIEGVTK